MIKNYLIVAPLLLLIVVSCSNQKNKQQNVTIGSVNKTQNSSELKAGGSHINQDFSHFLPEGYILFDSVFGAVSKEGATYYVLFIKGTDKKNVVKNDNGKMVDRNRRGLIILTEKNDQYEIALKNLSCFSSEHEEGGNYYAPDLWLDVGGDHLIVNYSHGRYGYWSYTFRWNNNDFELIGYDASENRGPVVNSTRSINFLSGKKQIRTNINDTAEGDDEVFVEKWEKLKAAPLIKLSEVKDFDELYFE